MGKGLERTLAWAGSGAPVASSVRNGAALALWTAGFFNVALRGAATRPGVVLAAFYILVSLPVINPGSILPIGIAAGGVAGLYLVERDIEPIMQGLSFGVGLAAFLGSVLLLRSTLSRTMSVAHAEARFAALSAIDRRGAALLIGLVAGAVFAVATFTFLGPLLDNQPDHERRRLAPVMLCGMCLSLLWSPFSIGMAFAAKVVPNADIAAGMELGAALSLIGVLAALGIYSRFRWSVVRGAFFVLSPLLLPVAALLAAVAAVCWTFRVHVTEAIVLTMPWFCGVFLLLRARFAIGPSLAATFAQSGRTLSDTLLYVAGLAFARALDEAGWLQSLMQSLAASDLAAFVLPGLAGGAVLLGMCGLHASISAGLVAVVGLSLPAGPAAGSLLALVLLVWSAATLLSFSSVNVAVASREFHVGVGRLIFSPNLAVMTILGMIAAGWLAWRG
jgi:hypothetical protein